MKRILILVLTMILLSSTALAETLLNTIPDTSQWGLSRTKFKETYGAGFQEIEVNGMKVLYAPGKDVSGNTMDAFFEFGSKQGNYFGLSKVLYLLDVTKKVSDSNLTKYYRSLIKEIPDDPFLSGKTSSIWQYDDCKIEITIGEFSDYNGSKNRTLAIVYSEPIVTIPANTSSKSKTMSVAASASCSNYNHVGNEWNQEFFLNGTKISRGSQITLSPGDTLTASATIMESDKKPDVGSGQESYTVTQADLSNGFTIKFNVSVRENAGRYSGNTAKWSVTFKFS